MAATHNVSDAVLRAQRKSAAPAKAKVTDDMIRDRFSHSKVGIAVDKDALDQQVREKRLRKEAEAAADRYYAEQALLNDKQAVFLEKERLKEKRENGMQLNSFHATMQAKESAREWEINDPHRLRKDRPPREDDETCGTASIQKFEGEDLDAANRRRAQAGQIHRWTAQQISEKNLKNQREVEAERAFAERLEQVNHKSWAIEKSIAGQRRDAAVARAEFNKKQAELKQTEALLDKQWKTSCDAQEIQNMLDSDLLTEGIPESHYSARTMKTLPPATLANIQHEQAAQRVEKEGKKKTEREEQLAADRREANERRMSIAVERAFLRERKQNAMRLGEERRQQAIESRARKEEVARWEAEPSTGYLLTGSMSGMTG
ncbi:hypothetical protein DIPPA_31487 [Diplonema papillatum]|nr:hypothetical protein DIPPA_31487 [Diplonema papillatum]